MKIRANCARMAAAVFTIAVFYASVCSMTCAVDVFPNQVQQAAGHGCDQMPSHHSDQSRNPSPNNPDCSQHAQQGLFVTKSGDLSQVQLSVTGDANASVIAYSSIHGLVASFTNKQAPNHAPPLISSIPLYQQISVLRI
ncbi:MAG TPA: hypothetical protein VOA64_13310 [Candidatus Dormibacteraeota bacterium]|nr:hypothetical protein [Candidatus Dormibacteraeota bacterium]